MDSTNDEHTTVTTTGLLLTAGLNESQSKYGFHRKTQGSTFQHPVIQPLQAETPLAKATNSNKRNAVLVPNYTGIFYNVTFVVGSMFLVAALMSLLPQ